MLLLALAGWGLAGVPGLDAGPLTSSAAAAGPRPNVLVIETDDQTVDQLKVMHGVNSLIGAHGATFANSFVNFSLCCPSRSTFLTGQYAHNHGVWSNSAPDGGFWRFEALHAKNNLAVWLRHAGYYTAMIGKYLNEYANKPLIPPGWSEWHAVAPDPYKPYGYTINDNGILVNHGQRPVDYEQDVLTRKSVRLVTLRASKPHPFFLWLNYTAPHIGSGYSDSNPPDDCEGAPKPPPRYAHAFDSEPLPTPPNFNEEDVSDKPAAISHRPVLQDGAVDYITRSYRCELESLLAVDDGVKALVAALKSRSALANTVIIFTSDNGYYHGEHRIALFKQGVYEESIRVPLQIRGPGIPQGVTIDPLAINADLAPTILDAANVRPRLTMDGRSLIPVINRPTIARNRALLIEEPTFAAVRTERFLYAEHETGERELYDLKLDPYELRNRDRAQSYAPVEARLATDLESLRTCAGVTCLVHP